jgi:hypothetical protein
MIDRGVHRDGWNVRSSEVAGKRKSGLNGLVVQLAVVQLGEGEWIGIGGKKNKNEKKMPGMQHEPNV